mmetsp:Transcript_35559/g.52966  ORF Transcript_35559/g.52966 Transcript_35559/m.52966 type:complete len:209 (+) Transcript_35559:224-850(+)
MCDVLSQGRINASISELTVALLVDGNWDIVVNVQHSIGQTRTVLSFSQAGTLINVSADAIISAFVDPTLSFPCKLIIGSRCVLAATFSRGSVINTLTNNAPSGICISDSPLEDGSRGSQRHHDRSHNCQLVIDETAFIHILRLEGNLQATTTHPKRHGVHMDRSTNILSVRIFRRSRTDRFRFVRRQRGITHRCHRRSHHRYAPFQKR